MRVLCGWILLCLLAVPSLRLTARSFPATPDATEAAQQHWGAVSHGFVSEGCTWPPPGSGTTVQIATCRAFALETSDAVPALKGFAETTPWAVTFSGGDGRYWLAGRTSPGRSVPGWTCLDGGHYCWVKSATPPAVPSGLVVLARTDLTAGLVGPAVLMAPLRRTTPLLVPAGTTLRLGGCPAMPPDVQIFDATGTSSGLVQFTRGACPAVHPAWWGAVGDGVSDDTGPLQQAIASVSGAAQGLVQLSAAAYRLTAPLALATGVTLRGVGPERSVLTQDPGATFTLLTASGQSQFRVEDLGLTGGGAVLTMGVQSYCFLAEGSSEYVVERVHAASCDAAGFVDRNGTGPRFLGVSFTAQGQLDDGLILDGTQQGTVAHCRLLGPQFGVIVSGPTTSPLATQPARGNTVQGCTITRSVAAVGVGIDLNGAHSTTVSGNTILGVFTQGIQTKFPESTSPAETQSNTIVGNTVRGAVLGIYSQDGAWNVIAHNTVADATSMGIRVNAAPHTLVQGNLVRNSTDAGISIVSSSDSAALGNRVLASRADATGTDYALEVRTSERVRLDGNYLSMQGGETGCLWIDALSPQAKIGPTNQCHGGTAAWILDEGGNTEYPISVYSPPLDVSAANTVYLTFAPGGLLIGRVTAYTTVATTGTPTVSLGNQAEPTKFALAQPVGGTIESATALLLNGPAGPLAAAEAVFARVQATGTGQVVLRLDALTRN